MYVSGLLGTTEVHGTHLSKRMSFIRHETVTRDIACYLYRSNFFPLLPSLGVTPGSEAKCQDYLCGTTEKRDISISSLEASQHLKYLINVHMSHK